MGPADAVIDRALERPWIDFIPPQALAYGIQHQHVPFLLKFSMKRTRVTHLIFSLEAGGMENGVVNLCNRLNPDLFDTSICVMKADGELEKRINRDRVTLYKVRRHFGNDPSVPLRIATQFWRRGVDIVHTHNWVTLVEGAVAKKFARVPVMIHGEHGYPIEERPRNVKVQRYVWSRIVTQLLSVSAELADGMAGVTGMPRDCIKVIPNGVDTTRFTPQPDRRQQARAQCGIPAEGIMIGMVARLASVKNHAGAIRALALLRQEGLDVHLVIAGGGDLQAALEQQARDENVNSCVHFLGFMEDVGRVYNALDIFLLNSHQEGMSNTIVEAMASGLPVVATQVGANPELLIEGETGYLVPPDNSEMLAIALRKLLEPELRARFGIAARRRIEDNFSIDTMVDQYTNLYLQLSPHPTFPDQKKWETVSPEEGNLS